MPANQKTPLGDRIIPWYFVMGFLIVFAVNFVFVRLAIKTNPGVVTEHAYEKGLAYNDLLAEAKAEKALGWNGSVTYQNGMLHAVLRDRQNNPLRHAKVTAYIDRPLQQGLNQSVALAATSNQDYAAAVTFPQHGQWDITLSILCNKQYAQIRQRLIVP